MKLDYTPNYYFLQDDDRVYVFENKADLLAKIIQLLEPFYKNLDINVELDNTTYYLSKKGEYESVLTGFHSWSVSAEKDLAK